MDEELNENELEERLYCMLHYTDDTQENINVNQKDVLQLTESEPRSTLRRYWKGADEQPPYQKINPPKEPPASKNDMSERSQSAPKEEKHAAASPPPSNALSMFQSSVPQNLKKTVVIVENGEDDSQVVELQSSDEDEVIEVALPPKPTITIESSDEEEVHAITTSSAIKANDKDVTPAGKKSPNTEREVSASPVPSVVSSVSDDFIRGDCIALNISSRNPNNQSFDFSLHGSDLIDQTPTKKKKKKKNKEANTSTPLSSTPVANATATNEDECFATPKSKAKNKRPKTKSYTVSDKSFPNPDVYDSDSNQSSSDLNKVPTVAEIIPDTDDYNLVSNLSETVKEKNKSKQAKTTVENVNINPLSIDKQGDVTLKSTKSDSAVEEATDIVDLTDTPDLSLSTSEISIDENIIMGNVTGFSAMESFEEPLPTDIAPKLGSTKVPAILYADLDFNNLNGKERVSKKRRYSLTTLRAEMEKFYNESWGGENFNHREIQKYMSRDKNLWLIDPKDRMSVLSKRKVTCNYCNRVGHRDDTCRMKPPVCYMCGSIGHYEPRCPRKICVNCGAPNHMYTTMCPNCSHWQSIMCAECGQNGHPSSHCPDLWRRYHNTISENTPLEENHQTKKHNQMYCSGCTRRGHFVHTCRVTVPFSNLPINSPYVAFYNPIYPPSTNIDHRQQTNVSSQVTHPNSNKQDATITGATPHRLDRTKRRSNSPVVHETHLNKRRNLSATENNDVRGNTKSPINNLQKRKTSQSKDVALPDTVSKEPNSNNVSNTAADADKAPEFIPLFSGNHDKQGQIIQDNEVSDTSDVVTSARIYITSEIIDKLSTDEGREWLKKISEKNNIRAQNADLTYFLNITGTVGDQEAFQAELRDWVRNNGNKDHPKPESDGDVCISSDQSMSNNIPKNRNNVLRVISKALDSLKDDLGDPSALFKELTYLQNQHQRLIKQKIVSPKQLSNNRTNMNSMSRKLNMVLLGQAGLADGPRHLNELYALQEKITNCRNKVIPPNMRQEIGQHYHSIFTPTPRNDYAELLSKYYISNKPQAFSKKKKNYKFKVSPKPNNKQNINIPVWQKDVNFADDVIVDSGIAAVNPPPFRKPQVEKTVNKLVFYQRRLLNARPIDAVLKKTRMTLVNQLNAQIATLGRYPRISPKALKKSRKIQEQAQLFLTNV